MTDNGASSAPHKDDPEQPPTPTTLSTAPRGVLITRGTWSRYAEVVTRCATSPSPQPSGGRFSSLSSKYRRLLHVFGFHDDVPVEIWDIVNDEMIVMDLMGCTICLRTIET